jgi:hypothetical protein
MIKKLLCIMILLYIPFSYVANAYSSPSIGLNLDKTSYLAGEQATATISVLGIDNGIDALEFTLYYDTTIFAAPQFLSGIDAELSMNETKYGTHFSVFANSGQSIKTPLNILSFKMQVKRDVNIQNDFLSLKSAYIVDSNIKIFKSNQIEININGTPFVNAPLEPAPTLPPNTTVDPAIVSNPITFAAIFSNPIVALNKAGESLAAGAKFVLTVFTDPKAAAKKLLDISNSMTPEQKKKALEVLVPAVISAIAASAVSSSSAGGRRK